VCEVMAIPTDSVFDRALERLAPVVWRLQLKLLKPKQIRALRHVKHYGLAAIAGLRYAFENSFTFQYYPETPTRHHAARVVCVAARCRGVSYNGRNDARAVCFFHDDTASPQAFTEALRRSRPGIYVINGSCLDISKRHVDILHKKAFGYGLNLDRPAIAASRDERFVVKSNANAAHQGRLVTRDDALSALDEDQLVVQKYVDTRVSYRGESWVCDHRVGVGDGRILFVIRKLRLAKNVFYPETAHFILTPPQGAFTPAETEAIMRLCRLAGLDIGELDILRDRRDRKLYVCDVSRTPQRMPSSMIAPKVFHCYTEYAKALRSLLRKGLSYDGG